jgi:type VI protein secretion system component VasA
VLIYLYIETRIHEGKSFNVYEILSVKKTKFNQLEQQAFHLFYQNFQTDRKSISLLTIRRTKTYKTNSKSSMGIKSGIDTTKLLSKGATASSGEDQKTLN